VNEPLTEFIAWSVISNVGWQIFERVFEEVDKESPPYYRKWIQLKESLKELSDNEWANNESKPKPEHYVYFVPGLVHIARDDVWNDFGHFVQGIKDRCELLKNRYLIWKTMEDLS